jgi:WD40 repeat protein
MVTFTYHPFWAFTAWLAWAALLGTGAGFASAQTPVSLEGHADPVWRVAFSPDGNTLVSCDDHTSAILWDVQARRRKAQLLGTAPGVSGVSYSPDGTVLATGGSDINFWDSRGRKRRRVFPGHRGPLADVAFSGDGERLASCGCDAIVRLRDVQSGKNLWSIRSKKAWSSRVLFLCQDKLLAAGCGDGQVRIYRCSDGQAVANLTGHSRTVMALALSPDGKTLVSSSFDGTVAFWDVPSFKQRARFKLDENAAGGLAFAPNGEFLAAGGFDGTIIIWQLWSRQVLTRLRGHKQPIMTVAFSPDGKYLASGGGNIIDGGMSELKLWDVRLLTSSRLWVSREPVP